MHHKREAKITSPILSLGDDGYRTMPIAFIVGIVGIGGALLLSILSGSGLARFGFAYLVNFCFFVTVSLGGLFFVLIHHLTRAGWSVTVRRIAEVVAMALIPLFLLSLPIVIPVLLGWSGVYIWNESGWTARYTGEINRGIEHAKALYLNRGFFSVRTVIYFAIWSAMAWFFYSNSLRQDETGDKTLTSKMQKFSRR